MTIRSTTQAVLRGPSALLVAALLLGGSACAQNVQLDVPYVPTAYDTVHRMLELADVQPDDKLIDLGSGDGRIVIQAVRDWGVRGAIGVDIDPERVREANENAREAGVSEHVEFIQGDLFEMDFSEATVLTMYLLNTINVRLRPIILDTLKPGTRVVSHVFTMGNWQPDATVQTRGLQAFMWIVPAKVEGAWQIRHDDGSEQLVTFSQTYQRIDGEYEIEGNTHRMTFSTLRGDEIRFSARGKHYIGKVDGNTITALAGPGTVVKWTATRH